MAATASPRMSVQVYRVYVKATPRAVWDAITKPEWTQRYGHRGRTRYELRPGGSYRAFGTEEMVAQGGPEVVVEGEVVESDPPRRLIQTWHPVWDPDTAGEPATRLSYEIRPEEGGVTRLTVIHDVEGAPNAAAMVAGEIEGAGGGWSYLLSDLKTLLETGRPMEG